MSKKYSVENQVFSIAESALSLQSNENILKAEKKQIRHDSEELIKEFYEGGKIEELPNFLTIQFDAMEKALMFGPTDVYVQGQSGQKVHTLKKLGVARFFQRAFKDIVEGFELKGMAPFKIVAVVPAIEQTNEEKLVEFCEAIKCDVVAIGAIREAFQASEQRTRIIRLEAEKKMQEKIKAREEQKAFEHQQSLISAFLDSGLTVDDIKKAQEVSEAGNIARK